MDLIRKHGEIIHKKSKYSLKNAYLLYILKYSLGKLPACSLCLSVNMSTNGVYRLLMKMWPDFAGDGFFVCLFENENKNEKQQLNYSYSNKK